MFFAASISGIFREFLWESDAVSDQIPGPAARTAPAPPEKRATAGMQAS